MEWHTHTYLEPASLNLQKGVQVTYQPHNTAVNTTANTSSQHKDTEYKHIWSTSVTFLLISQKHNWKYSILIFMQ